MCPRSPGKRHGQGFWKGSHTGLHVNLHTLMPHQLHAGPSMNSPTPVSPEQRRSPDAEGMQQYTHLARFARFAAIPLTLFA